MYDVKTTFCDKCGQGTFDFMLNCPCLYHLPPISDMVDGGSECRVYGTDDDKILFKLYDGDDYDEVSNILDMQAKYAEIGLAPEVLSNVIEYDECFGYYTEKVLAGAELRETIDVCEQGQLVNLLAEKLEAGCHSELEHNIGIKNGSPVLIDFGSLTMDLLNLG